MKWGYDDEIMLKLIVVIMLIGGIIAGIAAGKAYRKKKANQ